MGKAQPFSLNLVVIQDAAVDARKSNAWERPKDRHVTLKHHVAKGSGKDLDAVLNPK
jgi:hypothetical protein